MLYKKKKPFLKTIYRAWEVRVQLIFSKYNKSDTFLQQKFWDQGGEESWNKYILRVVKLLQSSQDSYIRYIISRTKVISADKSSFDVLL